MMRDTKNEPVDEDVLPAKAHRPSPLIMAPVSALLGVSTVEGPS